MLITKPAVVNLVCDFVFVNLLCLFFFKYFPVCALRNIFFARFWAGIFYLSLLFPCAGQFVKYVLKCICIVCESFTGLSCTGSWHCFVWRGVRGSLQAVGGTCGVAGSGDPLERPCVLPATLEQPRDTACNSWVCTVIPWNQQGHWLTSVGCQAPC